jgi:hypothetical protein
MESRIIQEEAKWRVLGVSGRNDQDRPEFTETRSKAGLWVNLRPGTKSCLDRPFVALRTFRLPKLR